ncbi:MAG: Crp/Fnr family transcriptional regulator [Anaerolineae bacterium]|nr:Crp/Fnr family transcriptional regulator [Anaerolineae bacterium]
MSYAYLLRNVSLFAQLNEEELDLLAAEFTLQNFRRGQVLFQQGSLTNCLYIVKSGSVQVTAFGRDNTITFTDVFRAEQYFGEFSLLDGLPRSGEAVALEHSDLLVLTRPTFFRFLERQTMVAIKLLVTVSRRMRFAESALDQPLVRSAEEKIVRLLLNIAQQYQTGARFSVRLTADDLAALSGVTRSAAQAVVEKLRQQGLLILDRSHIASVDLAALQAHYQRMVQGVPLSAD